MYVRVKNVTLRKKLETVCNIHCHNAQICNHYLADHKYSHLCVVTITFILKCNYYYLTTFLKKHFQGLKTILETCSTTNKIVERNLLLSVVSRHKWWNPIFVFLFFN